MPNPKVVVLTGKGPQMAVLTNTLRIACRAAVWRTQDLEERDSFLGQALFVALEKVEQAFPQPENLAEHVKLLGRVLVRLCSLTTIRTGPIDKQVIAKMTLQFERRRDQIRLVLPHDEAKVVKATLVALIDHLTEYCPDDDIERGLRHFLNQFPQGKTA